MCHHRSSIFYEVLSKDGGVLTIYEYSLLAKESVKARAFVPFALSPSFCAHEAGGDLPRDGACQVALLCGQPAPPRLTREHRAKGDGTQDCGLSFHRVSALQAYWQ